MSIEKIRHGAEITSSKLNEIIEALNNTNNDHQTIRDLGESIKTTISEVYNKLDTYSEQVGEHLDSLPEIKNLYADILLARDSVDWLDISKESEDTLAQISNSLDGYDGEVEESAQRLTIIRGTDTEITLDKPTKKDKQILIAYNKDTGRGILYFDYCDSNGLLHRIPVSASGDVSIATESPTLSFVNSDDGVHLKMSNPDGTTELSANLKGEKGNEGAQGLPGPKGDKGDTGPQGERGEKGDTGSAGSTAMIAIKFANNNYNENVSDTYVPGFHTYMGIKTYFNTDDSGTIAAKPYTWIKLTGETLYPNYDSETGELYFSFKQPSGELRFDTRGPVGPQGPEGKTPNIKFKVKNSEGQSELVPVEYTLDSGNTYVYDASSFRGEKGDKGDQGSPGPTGATGPKPKIAFKAQTTDSDLAELKDTTPPNSTNDAEYTIMIPKGKNGLSIVGTEINAKGETMLILSRNPDTWVDLETSGADRLIPLGNLKGDKGEKGDAGALQINGKYASTDELPTNKEDTEKVFMGAAYAITSVNDEGNSISELYIITDMSKSTWQEMYTNLGNIKGEQGDKGEPGKDGQQWYAGEEVDDEHLIINTTNYNQGDYYINNKTGKVYYVVGTTTSTRIFTPANLTLKGPKGDTGPTGPQGTSVSLSHTKEDLTHTITVTTVTQQKYVEEDGSIAYSPITNTDTITFNDGERGDQIQLRSTATEIQWKYSSEGDSSYRTLESLANIRGRDGSQIIVGTTSPTDIEGEVGDCFINKTTGALYKKVSDLDWGSPILSLLGKDGATWILGTEVTAAGTITLSSKYKVGDLYFNTTSNKVFKVTSVSDYSHTFAYVGALRGSKISYIDSTALPEASLYLQGDIILLANWDIYVHNGTGWGTKVGNIKGDKGDIGTIGPTGSYIKANKVTVSEASTTVTMAQSTYYYCTNSAITKLILKPTAPTSGTVGEYIVEFTYNTGKTKPSISFDTSLLSSGTTIKYANGFTTEDFIEGYTYILYIINNICYVSCVEV